MNVRKAGPSVSVAISQWTAEKLAMRVSVNPDLLKQLGWTRKTRVALNVDGAILSLSPHSAGNRLHSRGTGRTLSVLMMALPDQIRARPVKASLAKYDVSGNVLKVTLPETVLKKVA